MTVEKHELENKTKRIVWSFHLKQILWELNLELVCLLLWIDALKIT